MANIWLELKNKAREKNIAFTALAPMEDVTDTVFRQIVLSQGRPDIFFTEFTNCDGLSSKGRDHVMHSLRYTENEHPIIAQLWGNNPQTYIESIKFVIELGFDGVDINMGCPVNKVISRGQCSALINNPLLANELINASKEAVTKYAKKDFALSVKTRLGFNEVNLEWLEGLLKQNLDALTIHLRTVSELSKVPAHWELMPEIIKLRDKISPNTIIIGNGDIKTREQLETYGAKYGVDGLMIGRGIFDNLWLFNKEIDPGSLTPEFRISILKKHIELFISTWGRDKNIEILKKYFKIYIRDFEGAPQLKNKLMQLKNKEDMLRVLDDYQIKA
ncbi:MAG TPA: tRNA-dihydrouridine synthase [Candidatus Dojkabacteria bacterium]|nr:tRNA-dihydrouridine synthase [Candidatus Dojkabacteria bacterium]